jgi:hypothetical protein
LGVLYLGSQHCFWLRYICVMWVVTHVEDDADRFYIFSIFLSVVSWIIVMKFCNYVCVMYMVCLEWMYHSLSLLNIVVVLVMWFC